MAVKAEELRAGYGNDIIIDDISIHIPQGSVCSIIGPNGCGKSTLLKTLSRNLPINKGKIKIDNEDIDKIDTKLLAQKMAFLTQKPYIPEQFSVRELVSYGRFPHTNWMGSLSEKDHQIIDNSMKTTGIIKYQHRELSHLSGGEQQRVWLAMALAQEAEILLLDEPTSHLDISHQFQTLELIRELNSKLDRTILMVLHDLNQAARYSDLLFVMKNGKLITEGTPEVIITEKLLKNVFNIEAKIIHDDESDCPYFIPVKSNV